MAGDAFTTEMFEWLNAVAADAKIPPNGFKLAFVIGQHVNRKTGKAWPTQETLGAAIGATTRTVRSLVDALVGGGFLAVEPGRGRNISNVYRIKKGKPVSGNCDADMRKPASAIKKSEKGKPASAFSEEKEETSFRFSEPKRGNSLHEKRKPASKKEEASFLQNQLIEPTEEPTESFVRIEHHQISKKRKPKCTSEQFENWYRAYPRKAARKKAEAAYARVIASGEATNDELLREANRYAAERDGQDPRFTKFPASWLNAGCWLDETAPARPRNEQRPPKASGVASAIAGARSLLTDEDFQ